MRYTREPPTERPVLSLTLFISLLVAVFMNTWFSDESDWPWFAGLIVMTVAAVSLQLLKGKVTRLLVFSSAAAIVFLVSDAPGVTATIILVFILWFIRSTWTPTEEAR